MQADRLSTQSAHTDASRERPAQHGAEAEVDGLAGLPLTDALDKPEQLSFDFDEELSLFTRLLVAERAEAAPASVATEPPRAPSAAVRTDVSVQEIAGLSRVTRWGR